MFFRYLDVFGERDTDRQKDRQLFYLTYTSLLSRTKWFTIECI